MDLVGLSDNSIEGIAANHCSQNKNEERQHNMRDRFDASFYDGGAN